MAKKNLESSAQADESTVDESLVPVVAPEGATVCSVGGVEYEATEDGLFFVAAEHAPTLRAHFGQE